MRPGNVKSSHWWTYNALFFLEHILGQRLYFKFLGKREKALYAAIDKHAAQHPVKSDFKVIEYKKGEFTDPVLHATCPVVFRGAALDWPSQKKWNFDFFLDHYGHTNAILVTNDGMKDSKAEYEEVKFSDYIKGLKSGTKGYLKFSRIIDEQSVLREDLDYNWLRKFRAPGAKNDLNYFFMGSKNTMTPLHADYANTIYIEVEGIKRWLFYPTNDRLFIGARPRRQNYFYTNAIPGKTDDPEFPLLKLATPVEVLLHPGDVLYFPSLVWHQVENVTDTIAVAYKFATFKDGFRSSKMLFICFFLATRPWLIEMLLPWSKDAVGYKKK